jgi:NitT/TauT family transport system substrate-binding protein
MRAEMNRPPTRTSTSTRTRTDRRQRPLLWFAVFACVVGLTACRTDARRASAGATDRVRVVMQPFLAHAALYIGQAEGYFLEQGIDLELVRMVNTETAVPLLVSGEVDVLPGQAAPGLLNAIVRRAPIRMVAEKGRFASGECNSLALIVRPEQLLGRGEKGWGAPVHRISVDPQAGSLYFVETALQREGLSLDDFDRVSIPHAIELQTLIDGGIDVALTGEPYLTQALKSEKAVTWVGATDVLPDVEFSFLFYGANLLANRELGERFMAAYLQSVRQYMQGKTPRNLQIISAATREDLDVLRAACWPAQRADGGVALENVMRYQKWARSKGLIDDIVAADQLWDGGFIEAANRALGDFLPQ